MHQKENLERSKEAMVTVGQMLMKQRGITGAEVSMMMLSVLTVCNAMIAVEIDSLLQQIAASFEAEHSTKQ